MLLSVEYILGGYTLLCVVGYNLGVSIIYICKYIYTNTFISSHFSTDGLIYMKSRTVFLSYSVVVSLYFEC